MIQFERMSMTQDAAGQQLLNWTAIGEGWAAITPVSGREYFQASGEKAAVTHSMETALQPALLLTSRDRIRYHGRNFNILSVLNKEERNKDWILMCIEMISTEAPGTT